MNLQQKRFEDEVKLAIQDLANLKAKFPKQDNEYINEITEDMLRNNEEIRRTVREFHGYYYFIYDNKSEFEKPQ